MPATIGTGIEHDIIPDDMYSRMERLERIVQRTVRTVVTQSLGGSGGADADAGSTPGAGIPLGGIILWSGAVANIPEGWSLCDGTNGTPDLRNSFIVGAGDTYSPDDTGGSATLDWTHTHTSGTYATDNDAHTHTSGTYATDSDSHSHDVTGTSGAGSAHSHSINRAISPYSFDLGTDLRERDGVTQNESAHTHGAGTYATDSDGHSHDVTGSSASDTHNHDVTGSSASGGSAAEDIRPPYYALAYIMRMD